MRGAKLGLNAEGGFLQKNSSSKAKHLLKKVKIKMLLTPLAETGIINAFLLIREQSRVLWFGKRIPTLKKLPTCMVWRNSTFK